MFQLDEKYAKNSGRSGRTRTTTDEQFSDTYAEQGIQPTYKSTRPRAERAESSLDEAYPDSNQRFAPNPTQRVKQYRERRNDNEFLDQTNHGPITSSPQPPPERSLRERLIRQKKSTRLVDPGVLVARARVTGMNVWLMGWGLWLWGSVQVPFALISILMFGIAAMFYATESWLQSTWAGRQVTTIATGLMDALKVFGIDLSVFDPYGLAFVAGLAVLAIGLFTIMSAIFAYSLGFINCFGGRGSTAKTAALLLCFLGYGLPVVNLFPWFVLYLLAVSRYPK